MALTYYRSDDASAPVMSGQAGAAQALLKSVLVDGYGAKASLGWAEEFVSGTTSVFRAASGNRMRLQVDDTGTQEARLVGYESMSSATVGTGPFPTAAQVSGGAYLRKSSTANSTARPWIAIGDSTWFLLIVYAAQTTLGLSATTDGSVFFGDGITRLAGGADPYATLLMARETSGATTDQLGASSTNFNTEAGHYMPRAYTGIGGAINVGKSVRWGSTSAILGNGHQTTYPDPISGGLLMSKLDVVEQTASGWSVRMQLPSALRAVLHTNPANHFDTFAGVGSDAGKNFLLTNAYTGTSAGRVALQTS